jgi:hypothetical protein
VSAGSVIDERIEQLVAAHRPELEHLVDAELDRQLDLIVGERIAARNGNGVRSLTAAVSTEAEMRLGTVRNLTKVCTRCRVEKPVTEFERGRGTCMNCRRQQERQRAVARRAAEAEEPPRTDVDAGA